jgi:hypothetical protein
MKIDRPQTAAPQPKVTKRKKAVVDKDESSLKAVADKDESSLNEGVNDDAYILPPGTSDLLHGLCGDPFSILGRHGQGKRDIVRAFFPDARTVRVVVMRPRGAPLERVMRRVDDAGLYVGTIPAGARYLFRIGWADGWEETEDPYSFGLLLGDVDLYLFSEGRHRDIDHVMGAQVMEVDGVAGVRFAVWAPNARRVSIVADFNIWDGRRHLAYGSFSSRAWGRANAINTRLSTSMGPYCPPRPIPSP